MTVLKPVTEFSTPTIFPSAETSCDPSDGVYVYKGKSAVPLTSAWVDIRRSQDLATAGQTDEALRLAQSTTPTCRHAGSA
jgi:hypothetical protein